MIDEGLIGKYRHVLLSPLGLDVLDDILSLCHFGCTLDPDNKAMVGEHNVGVSILARLGIFNPDSSMEVVRQLANVIPQPQKQEVEE